MYVNAHAHEIKPEKDVVAVYSTLPDPFPEHNPARWLISAGIHPWLMEEKDFAEALQVFENMPEIPGADWKPDREHCMRHWLEKLDNLAAEKKIIAIGETGLDRVHNEDIDSQMEIFTAQLEIAEKYDLPVVIHCVKAFPELLSVRKRFYKTPWIVHSFRGNAQTALQLLEKNCYLSFGEAMLKSPQLQEMMAELPLDRVFFETDEAGCTIQELYEEATKIYKVGLRAIKLLTLKNFKKVFLKRP